MAVLSTTRGRREAESRQIKQDRYRFSDHRQFFEKRLANHRFSIKCHVIRYVSTGSTTCQAVVNARDLVPLPGTSRATCPSILERIVCVRSSAQPFTDISRQTNRQTLPTRTSLSLASSQVSLNLFPITYCT